MKKLILSVAIAAMVLDINSANGFFDNTRRKLAGAIFGEGHSPYNNNKQTRASYQRIYGNANPLWFAYAEAPAAQIRSDFGTLKEIVDSLDMDSDFAEEDIEHLEEHISTIRDFLNDVITLGDRIEDAQKASRRQQAYSKVEAEAPAAKNAINSMISLLRRHPAVLSGEAGVLITSILNKAALGYGAMSYALGIQPNVEPYMQSAFQEAGLTNAAIQRALVTQQTTVNAVDNNLANQVAALYDTYESLYTSLLALASGVATTGYATSTPAPNIIKNTPMANNSNFNLNSSTINSSAFSNSAPGTNTAFQPVMNTMTNTAPAFQPGSSAINTTPATTTSSSSSRSRSSRSSRSSGRGGGGRR